MFKINPFEDLATLVYDRERRILKMTTTNGWSFEVDIKEVDDQKTQSNLEFTRPVYVRRDRDGEPFLSQPSYPLTQFTYALQMVGSVKESRISMPAPGGEVETEEEGPEISGHTVEGVAGNIRALFSIPEPWNQETRDQCLYFVGLLEGMANGTIRPYDGGDN